MALELVSGADFLCKLMCGAGLVDLRGSPAARGPDHQNRRSPGGKNLSIKDAPILGVNEVPEMHGISQSTVLRLRPRVVWKMRLKATLGVGPAADRLDKRSRLSLINLRLA